MHSPRQEKHKDLIEIPGDYQRKALLSGSMAQRSWHRSRLEALNHLLQFNATDNVADIGCGSGITIEYINSLVQKAYGVDSNQNAIQYCKEYFKNFSNVEILQGTLQDTKIAKQSLTKIICTEVLEHVYDEQISGILAHWKTLLRPEGEVFITVPNDRSVWPALEWCLDRFHLVPKMADDQHVSHWTKSKLHQTLKNAGFAKIQVSSFNLISPVAFMFGANKVTRSLSRLETSLLRSGGPLLWAKASLV